MPPHSCYKACGGLIKYFMKLNKRFYRQPRKNKEVLGKAIPYRIVDEIKDTTLLRGIDIENLLTYLGGSQAQRKRDIQDIQEVLNLPLKDIREVNEGRKLIAWGRVKRLAIWAEIYEKDCINILFNGRKPEFINIDYSNFRIDLIEFMQLHDFNPAELERVFGKSWRSLCSNMQKGGRKISIVELAKVSDLTGVELIELLKYGGFC